MTIRNVLLAVFVLFAVSSCGGSHGRQPSPASTPILSGQVIGLEGNPAVNAAVQLSMLSTTTDVEGMFSFRLQNPGLYNLSVQAANGIFYAGDIEIPAGGASISVTLNPNPSMFSVIEVSPPLNSHEANLQGPIAIRFSRSINQAAAKADSFTFTPPIGTFDIEIEGDTAYITPKREMKPGQRHRLRISNVYATDGTRLGVDAYSFFTTTLIDNTPPRVLDTIPADGASSVPRNQAIQVRYSDAIAPLTGGYTASFEPYLPVNEISADDNVLRIAASGLFSANTEYVLQVGRVQDYAGNVSEPFSLRFKAGTTALSYDDIEPAWNVFAGAIVFSRSTGGRYDLFKINPDGTSLTRLTDTPANEHHPSFSSDGSLVAYASDESGNWDIWALRLSSGARTRITYLPEDETTPAFCGTFSQLISLVRREGSPASSRIYLMNADGSYSRRADETTFRDETEPVFHPLLDNQMLYVTSEGGDYDIFSKSAFIDYSNPINVNLTPNLTGNEYGPAFSADGSTIAFISDQSGIRNVWVMDPAGSAHYAVTRFSDPVHSLAYSPVSGDERVVVSMGPSGHRSLYIISLISGIIERRLTE